VTDHGRPDALRAPVVPARGSGYTLSPLESPRLAAFVFKTAVFRAPFVTLLEDDQRSATGRMG